MITRSPFESAFGGRHTGKPSRKRGAPPPGGARARRREEQEQQIAYFDWVRLQEKAAHPELRWAFHPPNGGARSKVEGAIFKAMGVRRGVLDVVLPLRRGLFVGLIIEFKAGKEQPNEHQLAWLMHFTIQGWQCHTLNDWEVAARVTLDYLALPSPLQLLGMR